MAARGRGSGAIVFLIKSEQQRIRLFTFIDKYIEYNPYRSIIYATCYPINNNTSFPNPIVGWDIAYSMIKKYYYDEIFFYLNMYIAGNNRNRLASNCNRTSELMDVLTSELKDYLGVIDLVKSCIEDDGMVR